MTFGWGAISDVRTFCFLAFSPPHLSFSDQGIPLGECEEPVQQAAPGPRTEIQRDCVPLFREGKRH